MSFEEKNDLCQKLEEPEQRSQKRKLEAHVAAMKRNHKQGLADPPRRSLVEIFCRPALCAFLLSDIVTIVVAFADPVRKFTDDDYWPEIVRDDAQRLLLSPVGLAFCLVGPSGTGTQFGHFDSAWQQTRESRHRAEPLPDIDCFCVGPNGSWVVANDTHLYSPGLGTFVGSATFPVSIRSVFTLSDDSVMFAVHKRIHEVSLVDKTTKTRITQRPNLPICGDERLHFRNRDRVARGVGRCDFQGSISC